MINSNEIFADFQCIAHRVLLYNFNFPSKLPDGHDYDYNFDYEIVCYERKKAHHFGLVKFYVSVSNKIDESSEEIIKLELDGGFIGNPNALEEQQFKDMLEINGTATLSQFARAHIMNSTTMSGLDSPITLPMINILELKKLKEKNQGVL